MTTDAGYDNSELTEREKSVLFFMAKGLSNREIGALLNLSRHTISDYAKHIFRKLDVTRRAEAAVIAAKRGIV